MRTVRPRTWIISTIIGVSLLMVAFAGIPLVTPVASEVKQVTGDITMGALVPLSGGLGPYGPGMLKGIEAAVYVINNSVDYDFTITLKDYDTKTDPTASAAAATTAVADGCEVVIGAAGSSNTLAANAILKTAKVVQISYASTSPTITAADDDGYLFRTVGSDALQGQAMSDLALDQGYKNACVIYLDNAYGQGVANVFKSEFEGGGANVLASVAYDEKKTDFAAEISFIKTYTSADLIVDVSYAVDGGA